MSNVCESRSKRIERTDLTANEIIEMFYDYAVKCLEAHGLDVDEYHGLVCIKLCEMAQKHGNVEDMNSFYRGMIHIYVHRLAKRAKDNDIDYVPIDAIENIGIVYDLEISCFWDSLELAMNGLSEKEKIALKTYYSSSDAILDDVAQVMGCYRENARHYIASGLRRIRSVNRRKYIEDYAEI